jgi:hypothetical protein
MVTPVDRIAGPPHRGLVVHGHVFGRCGHGSRIAHAATSDRPVLHFLTRDWRACPGVRGEGG